MRLLFIILVCCMAAGAQTIKPKPVKVLFVFDASRSMQTRFGSMTRMDGAKQLFNRFVDTLSRDPNMQFALRMYGHTVKYPPGDCKDSKLVVPFGKANLGAIKDKVKAARPTGITPIEHSLTEAANDFKDNKSVNIVIIITDGIEECGGDPCRARQKLIDKGIAFRPFIVGIGLTEAQIKTFECVGTYFDMESAGTFSTIAGIIQQQKLNRTTVQVNLLDSRSQPVETNVNMTIADAGRGEYRYNYIHTLNRLRNPDTLTIDEFPVYRVTAHTIPPVHSDQVKLSPGKHNIIAIDAPQGTLDVTRPAGAYNYNERVKCVVRRSGEMSTLHAQELNTTEKYITGNYDLEILTLPRTIITDVSISQSSVTTITVANAGMLQVRTLEAGDGCVMIRRNGKLERVCGLTGQTQQVFYLQPGQYVAAWRAKSLRGSIYTIEKSFRIVSDQQTMVEFFK